MLIEPASFIDVVVPPEFGKFNGLLVKSLVSRTLFRNLAATTSPTTRTRIWHSHISQTGVKNLAHLVRQKVKECL